MCIPSILLILCSQTDLLLLFDHEILPVHFCSYVYLKANNEQLRITSIILIILNFETIKSSVNQQKAIVNFFGENKSTKSFCLRRIYFNIKLIRYNSQ